MTRILSHEREDNREGGVDRPPRASRSSSLAPPIFIFHLPIQDGPCDDLQGSPRFHPVPAAWISRRPGKITVRGPGGSRRKTERQRRSTCLEVLVASAWTAFFLGMAFVLARLFVFSSKKGGDITRLGPQRAEVEGKAIVGNSTDASDSASASANVTDTEKIISPPILEIRIFVQEDREELSIQRSAEESGGRGGNGTNVNSGKTSSIKSPVRRTSTITQLRNRKRIGRTPSAPEDITEKAPAAMDVWTKTETLTEAPTKDSVPSNAATEDLTLADDPKKSQAMSKNLTEAPPSKDAPLIKCPPGWIGNACQNFIGCADFPCLNGGDCRDDSGIESFNCYCPTGRFGVRCESNVTKADWMRGSWGIGFRFNAGLFIEDDTNRYSVDRPYNVSALLDQLNSFPPLSRPKWVLVNLSQAGYGDMYTSPHPILTPMNFGSTPYSEMALPHVQGIDPFTVTPLSHPVYFDYSYDPPILKCDHFARIATSLQQNGYKV